MRLKTPIHLKKSKFTKNDNEFYLKLLKDLNEKSVSVQHTCSHALFLDKIRLISNSFPKNIIRKIISKFLHFQLLQNENQYFPFT